ncbi:MAG: hypothetical protein ACLGH0_01665, partial [Thermoanaerobaculia bacterium]
MIRLSTLRFAVVLAILTLPLSAFAKDEIGTPTGGGSQMEWQLKVTGHEKVTLRVIDQYGEVIVKEFTAGKSPVIRLSDLGGNPENGQYTYELRLERSVPEHVKKALANARANNDDAAARKIMKENGLDRAVTQSGVITILNGFIVSPQGTEADANDARITPGVTTDGAVASNGVRDWTLVTNDQVIPDDLIVQGSTCTGFDCVNNESFGFDTFRMKENNLRINFDDTSTSAGYPANDWRIVANDSASGGANYLAIEDSTAARNPFIVEAGSPSNAVYVDSTGRIGFRNSSPGLDLHMTTGDTPAVRFEQTNSGGFTAQTWDIGANEANFFVRDLTGGSKLSFRIRPGAPTSSIDISADGDVGFSEDSPNANARIDVSDSTQVKARIALTGQEYFQASNTSTDGVAILLGTNRTGNRQIWFADTASLTQNSTNKVIRIAPNSSDISVRSTDNTVNYPLLLQSAGGFVGMGRTSASHPVHVG